MESKVNCPSGSEKWQLKAKFVISVVIALLWVSWSTWIAKGWISEVAEKTGYAFMLAALLGIAFIPGFIVTFLYASIALDRRVKTDLTKVVDTTVLIAAFNEESNILKPLLAIEEQKFNGKLEVIVIDDGSSDNTSAVVWKFTSSPRKHSYKLITLPKNAGKSAALNAGLKASSYDAIISMDADTTLATTDALQRLISNLGGKYRSVAGAVISRNPKKNWITRIQEWDYLLGISIVKRVQSMYSGTLVCQGAFSAYEKSLLLEIGGWKHVVGEDIVLTWDVLRAGNKTYHCADAVALTDTPESYKQFFHQRKRWSRGLIEAFRSNWKLLFKARLSTIFILYNLLFPFIDVVFAFIFIPSVIGAIFFGYYLMASEKTLWIIPLSLSFTIILYFVQKRTFRGIGLPMSKNLFGMFFYVILFQILQTPATLAGYGSEALKLKKNWGTKKSSNLILSLSMILLFSSCSSGLIFSQNQKTQIQKAQLGSTVMADADKNLMIKSWAGYQRGTDSLAFSVKLGKVLINDKVNKNSLSYLGFDVNSKINKTFAIDLSCEQYISSWKPFLYDGVIKIAPLKKMHMEVVFSRGLIETQKALDGKISVFSNGLTADYELIDKRLILVGGYINQQFTDNNSRNIYIGKLVMPIRDWFALNYTAKLLRANDVSANYFCPKRFDTHTIGAHKYVAVINEHFLLRPEIGGGIQHVNDTKNGFYFGKLSLKGSISKKISIDMFMLYSTAISEFSLNNSYNLFYGNLKLSYSFN